MKKHSEWRKGRNYHRRLVKAASAIERLDDARAEFFKEYFAKMNTDHGYIWFMMVGILNSEWPDVADMFISVSNHEHADPQSAPGVYQVVGHSASASMHDELLRVVNIATKDNSYLWFPRMGQSVISCKELSSDDYYLQK